ncbi:MAG: ATP-binding protein [Saprospirales bacterium]|nr:ATP-binding protein [Saprospirales bacterium]MBK8493207.1 ATP-binding protein [Saprospirales bacterium]
MNLIDSQLTGLRLHGMARSWQALLETRQAQELSFTDGLALLLQAEQDERNNRRFARLRKNAGFRYSALLEQLSYDTARGLDKSLISRLATADYLEKGESVLITGATGCGKSFLASALGHQACMQGYSVAYFNVQKLLIQTKLARSAGTIARLFERLAKTRLLILDDFGLTSMEAQQRLDILELIEDRHATYATIIASQLPVVNWYDVIGEPTIADAILDRLIHTSHRIELKGDSMRKKM